MPETMLSCGALDAASVPDLVAALRRRGCLVAVATPDAVADIVCRRGATSGIPGTLVSAARQCRAVEQDAAKRLLHAWADSACDLWHDALPYIG